jgi:ribosomal protein S18 acetylase RimI-like enzyme
MLTIANVDPREWEKFQRFFRYAYHMKGEMWAGGNPLLKSNLARPNYWPEKDIFLAEWNRRISGVADITPELRIARVILDWFVHPAYPRKKVGRELLKYACQRGRQIGAKKVHVCVPEEDQFARDFFVDLGFEEIRCFIELEASSAAPFEQDIPIVSGEVDHFRPGDEALLAFTQNRVFLGSWGFCPNSPDEIRYYLRLTGSKWQDILLIRDDAKITAYFWPYWIIKRRESSGKKKWRIHMFGVDPEFQGKGWGKKILAAGLKHVRNRGASSIELTVNSENSPALTLCRAFGFKMKSRHFWYEKLLT